MDLILEWMRTHLATPHVISTGVLLLLAICLRWVLLRQIRRSTRMSDELRRRWMVQIRNAALLFVLLGLLIIWGSELRTVALSAVAIAAAIVIATKELIMCISGTLLEGSAQAFRIGDRIEVSGFRGDVFDQTLLTTTILEIGPGELTHQHTGRAVVVPNSVFLTQGVVNETFTEEYILHSFIVPLRLEDDWRLVESVLLTAARDECRGYLEDARRHMESMGQEQGLRSPSVEPRVTVQLPEPGRLNLLVRVPAPARRRGRVEQSILRRVLPELARASKGSSAAASAASAPRA
ncbi:MAG: mechanosensitive ion channel family protein [Planctomycetota bacterium]|nr:mechanosensitive ion channel family protein [Planctomycetota bacterium]